MESWSHLFWKSRCYTCSSLFLLQNHRVVGVGRNLWRSSDSTPPAQAGLPRAHCPGLWAVSIGVREYFPGVENSSVSLGNLCQSLVTLREKKCFWMFRWKVPGFPLLTASSSVSGHHWKRSGSILFTLSLQVFIWLHTGKILLSILSTLNRLSDFPRKRDGLVS